MRLRLYRETRRPWFAWLPVYLYLDDTWVWLEWVERKSQRLGLLNWWHTYYELQ